MACNVFGTPVTIETLKGMPEYVDNGKITRKDLAEVALAMKNAEAKDVNARSYVENISKMFEGDKCVLGLIYNATGELIRFENAYNWYGFVAPAFYPIFIENGQWGVFTFIQKDGINGAYGSVVYRGYDFQGNELAFYVGWSNTIKDNKDSNLACVHIDALDLFNQLGPKDLQQKLDSSNQHSSLIKGKKISTAVIGHGKVVVLEVIHRMTLEASVL